MKGYKMTPYLFKEEDCIGDKFSLDEFIKLCEVGSLIDYDGHISNIIVNGYVVSETEFYPSEVLDSKDDFLLTQKELGTIEIVWCNK